MTTRTRGRVLACLVIGLIALPAEALLLPVARTPNPAEAAVEWTGGLSAGELQSAALDIDGYPVIYRRAIMSRLDPQGRAEVWRGQFRKFLAKERSLTPDQIAVVQRAMELLSAEAFDPPLAPDMKEAITEVFNDATVVLGPRTANELFVTLGPTQLQANALPWTQRLADKVRAWRVAEAELPDCNCNIDIDTCDISWDPWLQCSELFSCNFDLGWPMCGPLWSWACTGWCRVIQWPNVN